MLVEKRSDDGTLSMYHHAPGSVAPGAPKGLILDPLRPDVIVCHTSVYTPDYTPSTFPNDESSVGDIDWSSALVMTAHEGTIIRVFWYSTSESIGKWYVTTHNRLDSSDSRWGCPYSFKTLFHYAIKDHLGGLAQPGFDLNAAFYEKLNKTYVHTFMLRTNSLSRIVCDAPTGTVPKIYFAGVYPKDIPIPFEKDGVEIDLDAVMPIPDMDSSDWWLGDDATRLTPVQTHHPKTKSEAMELVLQSDYHTSQGIVVFTAGGVYRVLSDAYADLRTVRGNNPNMLLRYAQLRKAEPDVCKRLVDLFGESHGTEFSQFEDRLMHIATYIAQQYNRRYVDKAFASVTPTMYIITRKLHDAFGISTVTAMDAWDMLNQQDATYLLHLVSDTFAARPQCTKGYQRA